MSKSLWNKEADEMPMVYYAEIKRRNALADATNPEKDEIKRVKRPFISVTKMSQVGLSSTTVDKQQIGHESFSFDISFL